MNATAPLLQVKGVTLQYKTPDHLVTATYRIDFEVFEGERFILLGPSGCGKSTLLKAVGGYMMPTEGEIRLKGNLVKHQGPDRMIVLHEFAQPLPCKASTQTVTFPVHSARRLLGRELEDR